MYMTVEAVERFLQDVDTLFPVPLSQKQELSELAAKFAEKATICTVCEHGRITAMVAGYTDNVVNDMAYISVVATLPAAQGKGFASRLVREFVEIARQKPLTAVHLYAVRSNVPAIEMYRKIGFEEWFLPDEPRPDDVHLIYRLQEE